MTKKETIKLYDHSLAVSQVTLHGYQEECMKCETSMQGVKHFKKIRKLGNISHLQLLWFFQFIRQINEGEVSHFSDFPAVNAIRTFCFQGTGEAV